MFSNHFRRVTELHLDHQLYDTLVSLGHHFTSGGSESTFSTPHSVERYRKPSFSLSCPFYLTLPGAFHGGVSFKELVMNVIHVMQKQDRVCGGREQCVGGKMNERR